MFRILYFLSTIVLTGFYFPIFARIFELLSLVFVVIKVKKLNSFFIISFVTFLIFVLGFTIYHYDRFFISIKDAMYLLRTPIFMCSTYLIIIGIWHQKLNLKRSLNIWLLFYIFIILDIIYYLIIRTGKPLLSHDFPTLRTFGFADPNSFAAYIFLTITFFLYYRQVYGTKINKDIFGYTWIICATLVFLFTGSRGAMLALFSVLFFEGFLRFIVMITSLKIKKITITIISLFIIILSLQVIVLNIINLDFFSYWRVFDESGGSNRLGRWINALNFMNFEEYSYLFGYPMTSGELLQYLGGWPHNSYIKILLNYGPLILIVFFGLILFALYKVRHNFISRSILIFLLVECLTNDFVTSPIPGIYLGVAIAFWRLSFTNKSKKELQSLNYC